MNEAIKLAIEKGGYNHNIIEEPWNYFCSSSIGNQTTMRFLTLYSGKHSVRRWVGARAMVQFLFGTGKVTPINILI